VVRSLPSSSPCAWEGEEREGGGTDKGEAALAGRWGEQEGEVYEENDVLTSILAQEEEEW
jgi:hypothetical protein